MKLASRFYKQKKEYGASRSVVNSDHSTRPASSNSEKQGGTTSGKKGSGIVDSEKYWHALNVERLARKELKEHLELLGVPAEGSKQELRSILNTAIVRRLEQLEVEEKTAQSTKAKAKIQEERGAVYAAGLNNAGQLGLGDCLDREAFTVLTGLAGKNIHSISAGEDLAFAITDDGTVFTWGGNGVGCSGCSENGFPSVEPLGEVSSNISSKSGSTESAVWQLPREVTALDGEEAKTISVGSTHAIACTMGGDVFTWGVGSTGQLGHGSFTHRPVPALVDFPHPVHVEQALAGQHFCMTMADDGALFGWGAAAEGQLGLGITKRLGCGEEGKFFPAPSRLPSMIKYNVRMLACGASHTVLVAEEGVFSWGCGNGGRLGVGDTADRLSPSRIEALDGMHVFQVSCGTWHSAAVVAWPPLEEGGRLYTWGSGYHGQLALGSTKMVPKPTLVSILVDMRIVVRSLACGPYHNALISAEGELYTWGATRHGCLGRRVQLYEANEDDADSMEDLAKLLHLAIRDKKAEDFSSLVRINASALRQQVLKARNCAAGGRPGGDSGAEVRRPELVNSSSSYSLSSVKSSMRKEEREDEDYGGENPVAHTSVPGHVLGFGVIVDGIGRGRVREVVCGRYFTLVLTDSYEGPTVEVAENIIKMRKKREEELAKQARCRTSQGQREATRKKKDQQRLHAAQAAQRTVGKRCELCNCAGFRADTTKIFQCADCRHHRDSHVLAVAKED